MTKQMGVWIDHRAARLIEVKGAAAPCESTIIKSEATEVPKSMRNFSNGGRGKLQHFAEGAAQKHAQRKRRRQLAEFYDAVAERVLHAEEIVVLGPGTAHSELAERLRDDRRINGKLRAVESVDANLTDAQVDARVKSLLGEDPPRIPPR